MKASSQILRRFLSDYGMVLVLIVLGAYYSLVTNSLQQPTDEDAARQLASQVSRNSSVLLVARSGDEDAQFLKALGTAIRTRGANLVGSIQGEPRDARITLEKLNGEGKVLEFIATTKDCAAWPLLQNVGVRFPALGQPKTIVPVNYRWPTFLTRQNLLNVANQIAVVAILAVGMTLVIITGGIDLSVGSLIALSAVIVTVLIRDIAGGVEANASALVICSIAGVGLCGTVGLLSGALITGLKVPPFIATLGVMQVASGLSFILAKGGSIYEVPDSFTWLGRGTGIFGIPNAVWLMLILYLATHMLMTRTVLGRRIYAVGGNPLAARLSGVSVPTVLMFAYAFCGAMAGLGGVLQASQLKSGAPTYGQMYELYAIAAVVVGGTSLSGGEGRVFGTLIGAFIIAVIQNGMNLTGVESYRQKVVLGMVILIAVVLDLLKRKDWQAVFRSFRKPAPSPVELRS